MTLAFAAFLSDVTCRRRMREHHRGGGVMRRGGRVDWAAVILLVVFDSSAAMMMMNTVGLFKLCQALPMFISIGVETNEWLLFQIIDLSTVVAEF